MVLPPTYNGKDLERESQSGPIGSNVEDTTMVPSPTPTTVQNSASDFIAAGCGDLTYSGEIYNVGRGTKISCLAIIWDQS